MEESPLRVGSYAVRVYVTREYQRITCFWSDEGSSGAFFGGLMEPGRQASLAASWASDEDVQLKLDGVQRSFDGRKRRAGGPADGAGVRARDRLGTRVVDGAHWRKGRSLTRVLRLAQLQNADRRREWYWTCVVQWQCSWPRLAGPSLEMFGRCIQA